ncbi:unnamed protein product [Darwinula stevensoni]|uniref:Uncharacterized protein n=1 Tax=Darwinula stevensoni TaxID=69355 RepID=A0A7R8XIV7_9CRUS|nr:unnamed protein product [Darwinula stevensoni]CAG0894216.1 unnamed protein product [Darwinula stevensoni]
MGKPKRKVKPAKYEESESEDSDLEEGDDDMDSDYDPDEASVPGGGKNVESLAAAQQRNLPKEEGGVSILIKTESKPTQGTVDMSSLKMQGFDPSEKLLASGLVMKKNVPQGYDVIKMKSTPMEGASMSESFLRQALKYPQQGPLHGGLDVLSMLAQSVNRVGQAGNPGGNVLAQLPSALGMANGMGSMGYPQSYGIGVSPNNFMPGYYGPDGNFLLGNAFPKSGFPVGASFSGIMAGAKPPGAEGEEEDDDDEEELGLADTFSDYMPSKLKVGSKHPDPVVETATLASVKPPNVWYNLKLPSFIMDRELLSALQLEAIVYACQQHEQYLGDGCRAGYLIGDGAGVGKGRTIAGVIYENWLQGRNKAIWVSVSSDLKYDSERDLKDIQAKEVQVYPLNKMKYAKIYGKENGFISEGVIYSTYSALIGESQGTGKYRTRLKQLLDWCGPDFDGVLVFDECHRAKNLVPTGSTKPTKTGLTVLELQQKLPKARVVYASATGASEPRNMAYMTRLGIWGPGTPFREFGDFISSVEKRGVGAMEIVAMDMKLRGTYIARQLSFHGVSFKIEDVPLAQDFITAYDEAVKLWVYAREKFEEAACLLDADRSMRKTMWSQFWGSHQRFFKYLCIGSKVKHAVRLAREAIKMGKCVVIGLQSTGEARTLEALEKEDGTLTEFVSTAKAVFQTLVEKHFPAPDRNRIARLLGIGFGGKTQLEQIMEETDPKDGCSSSSSSKRKPMRQAASRAKRMKENSSSDSDSERNRNSDSDFTLSDGEASSSVEEEEDEEDSSSFEGSDTDEEEDTGIWVATGKKRGRGRPPKKKPKPTAKANGKGEVKVEKVPPPSKDVVERTCQLKDDLLKKIEDLGDRLPPNTLDQLIDELGGPENVAEMTGRKGRVIADEGGKVRYESRSEEDIPLEQLNLREKARFMDNVKDVAIISEAASSGISLQSDKRVKNQRRRVHITLELPWSADRAIQQFGRTHRSNQANAPEYVFLISNLAGESRFASIVAKRLESLGALTHGDRRATETRDLSRFNIDNKYGRAALEATMKTIMGYEFPIVKPPEDYQGDFLKDVQIGMIGVGLIISEGGVPALDKDFNNISKFLNRILGLPVELQNRLFQYFTDTLNAIVSQAKKAGRYDLGILDLGTSGDTVRQIGVEKFEVRHATGKAWVELHKMQVERGMSWEEAEERQSTLSEKDEGFYLSNQVRNNKTTAILAVLSSGAGKTKHKNERYFTIYRPNTGRQMKQELFGELIKKYRKAKPKEAKPHWNEQYEASITVCSHAYWNGNCRRKIVGWDCDVGLRSRVYHILCGAVLNVWTKVEAVTQAHSASSRVVKMQVVRLRTEDGTKIVGTIIPNTSVEHLKEVLKKHCEEQELVQARERLPVKQEDSDDF